MMALSAVIGAVASVLGVYLSWAFDVPTGAMIVLVVTALFLIAFVVPLCVLLFRRRPAPRTRSTVARKKVAAGVASVLVLVGAGITYSVLPGSGDSGLESNSGASSFAAVANAAEDATDGAATGRLRTMGLMKLQTIVRTITRKAPRPSPMTSLAMGQGMSSQMRTKMPSRP